MANKKEAVMPQRKSLPNFSSYEEAAEWLDTHSTANLRTKPVKVTLSPNLRLVIVDSNDNPVKTISKKNMSRQIQQIPNAKGSRRSK